MDTKHRVMQQTHTGSFEDVSSHDLFMDALESAREGKATATPSPIRANIWQIATPRADGTFNITLV